MPLYFDTMEFVSLKRMLYSVFEIVGIFDIYLQCHVCAGNTLWTSLSSIVDNAVGDNRSLLIVWLELTLRHVHKSHLRYNAGGTRDISNKSASVI